MQYQKNYVPALPQKPTMNMPINGEIVHTIDAAPLATQHVEVKTSGIDRALGFLIASLPLYSAFALTVVLVCVFFAGVPFMSLATLLIALLAFVAAWIIGWGWTLQHSAEGIALFEAKAKWTVIAIEQQKRWQHWERMIESDD